VAIAIRIPNSREESTGAKQSEEFHWWGSRLPSATIQYFARSGFPWLSCLILEIAMVGKAGPIVFLRIWY